MKKKIKSITLFVGNDPNCIICPGHVDQKTFNEAVVNEGWDHSDYKQNDLKYGYWKVTKSKTKKGHAFYRLSVPGKPGVKPFTYTSWD